MEDVLDTYALPYDSEIPLICMDERPVQLLGEVVAPIAMKPGQLRYEDHQYTREGVCSVFVFVEPHAGWRHIEALLRRTKLDWAHQIERLIVEFYPKAKKIRLVMDNLNTHVLGALYSNSTFRQLYGKCVVTVFEPSSNNLRRHTIKSRNRRIQ